MFRRIAILVVVMLALVIVFGFILTFIQKMRLEANQAASWNNLRQLALFAAHHADPAAGKGLKLPDEVPAATIALTGVPPDNRLSWMVKVLPGLDRTKNPIEKLLEEIDVGQPWSSERNQQAARLRLATTLCPENTPQPPPDGPAITCYVGIAGVGLDAATIELPPTGPVPPRAGAFRYDAPTPFDRILNGISQSLLMGETAADPGPWLQGGPSTARGVDDGPGTKPQIGFGGQFGGYFPAGGNFAFCDGSVRLFTPQTTPSVFLKQATIAGGDKGPVPE